MGSDGNDEGDMMAIGDAEWQVEIQKRNWRPDDEHEWQIVSFHPSKPSADEAAERQRFLNQGQIYRVTPVQAPRSRDTTWSVYEAEISQGPKTWVRVSTWGDRRSADKAKRVKRLSNHDRVYEVFRTGDAPEPPAPEASEIALAKLRRERAEIVARSIYNARIGNPNLCRARRPGNDDIRSRCMEITDHVEGHTTAYDLALATMTATEAGEGPLGNQTPGRTWTGLNTREGRARSKPERRLDAGENDDDQNEVTPPGDGYPAGSRKIPPPPRDNA